MPQAAPKKAKAAPAKAAAAKNAFVLLAQHKPHMAAAFFILGARPVACALACHVSRRDLRLTIQDISWPLVLCLTATTVPSCLHGAPSHKQMPVTKCSCLGLACAAGHLRDAVGVCARELGDPQLALFLARLLEPSPGALLHHTLADNLLPREAPLARGLLVA